MSSEKIKYIYAHAPSKSVDYMGTILLLLLVASVFTYLYTNTQKKMLRVEWKEQKCNPRKLFFSGFLNPLSKDPWTATQENFDRCVATSIYKDPNLSKEIKRNERYIKLHDNEIKQNLAEGEKGIDQIRKQWKDVQANKEREVRTAREEAGKIFEKQGYIHTTLAEKTTQLFEVLKFTIIYIQGILVYRVSQHKTDMDIEKTHDTMMKRYAATYDKYKEAYNYLDQGNWTGSINRARDAIKEYNDMSADIRNFIRDHEYQMKDINKSCYDLKYNLDDNSCSKIFPKLLETVDYEPIINNAFKL